jgi:hypothetical protein
MPKRRSSFSAEPVLATALAAALILIGGLVGFGPHLTRKSHSIVGVPTPVVSPKGQEIAKGPVLTEFPVALHQQACMDSITIEPGSRTAKFQLRPAQLTERGGPPVELVLSAPGYREVSQVPGGYLGGSVAAPLIPPPRSVIGSVCFVNRGKSTVLLDGISQPGTVFRSATTIDGRRVNGEIAVTLLGRPRSLLASLGEVFGHVSVLTDRLLPVWLVWLLAILVTFGVPLGVLAALYLALREDEDEDEAAATS